MIQRERIKQLSIRLHPDRLTVGPPVSFPEDSISIRNVNLSLIAGSSGGIGVIRLEKPTPCDWQPGIEHDRLRRRYHTRIDFATILARQHIREKDMEQDSQAKKTKPKSGGSAFGISAGILLAFLVFVPLVPLLVLWLFSIGS